MLQPPRQFGECSDYDGLIAICKARLIELDITHATFEMLTGWPTGYAGKIFGNAQIKKLGASSLIEAFQVLGLKLAVVEDMDAVRKMEKRWEKRVRADMNANRSASLGKATIKRVFPVVIRELSRKGVEARMTKTTPEERSRAARIAARARWAQVRAAKRGAR